MTKEERKKTNMKGKERQMIQIRHIHTYTVPKSTWIAGTLKLPTYLWPRSLQEDEWLY